MYRQDRFCQVLSKTKWCFVLAGVASALPAASAETWRDAAHARIESHRKSDLSVRVIDTAGSFISDADVRVEMKAHDFRFGTAVSAKQLTENTANGNLYRQKLLENFNEVVFENDLKWPPTIGLWGNTNFSESITNAGLDWLEANDLPARGHYLSWATWSGPDAWGNSQNLGTLPTRLFDHITDKANTIGDHVYEWDVINHPVGWLNDTYENRIGPDFYGDIVDHARSVVPTGTDLWINEDNVISGGSAANDYERIVQKLIDDGSPVDGIGFQAHFIEEWGRVSNSTPEQVYSRIDRFDELVSRLRVTEFDIDVGADEALQGQLMTDYLTAIFSHEDIEAITMWGFWAGRHWRGENGALYRQDWTEKPSLTAYQDLVLDQWWTDESGESDADGLFETRAFEGTYDVTVTLDGVEYVVSDYLLTEDATLEFVVEAPGLAGDFNGDGVVDAIDYVAWRDDPEAVSDLAQYDTWRANYGTNAATSNAVPEPSALVVALGMLAVSASRRRRSCGTTSLSTAR